VPRERKGDRQRSSRTDSGASSVMAAAAQPDSGMVWLSALTDIQALRAQLAAEAQTVQVLKVVLQKEMHRKLTEQQKKKKGRKGTQSNINRIFRKAQIQGEYEDIIEYPQVQQICDLDYA